MMKPLSKMSKKDRKFLNYRTCYCTPRERTKKGLEKNGSGRLKKRYLEVNYGKKFEPVSCVQEREAFRKESGLRRNIDMHSLPSKDREKTREK